MAAESKLRADPEARPQWADIMAPGPLPRLTCFASVAMKSSNAFADILLQFPMPLLVGWKVQGRTGIAENGGSLAAG